MQFTALRHHITPQLLAQSFCALRRQQAVATVLNAIYEEDFLGFSYGFRPGRSQHDALDALTVALKGQKVNWILDADITAFFDEIDHEWMLMFLGHQIADRRLLGLICKWLQAGVGVNARGLGWVLNHDLKRSTSLVRLRWHR